ncbi:hypothetical protein, partial [Phascolarctobacterium succinatutens]|uniref:hypothetical protein n=1 Tax=Phascolarctobacterium succinatutens TaxID=626940 RepID=UPI003AF05EDB
MGESLNSINASAYAGVSHSGGTKVAGTWNYIIEDSSWKDSVAPGNYKYGYVDLVDSKLPKGFKTAEDPNTELTWNDTKQCYTYKGNPVDYSNIYVIDGKIGVFTNKDGSKVYTGNVFGKNNEVLMTVKDANNKFYSYWASEVTDPSATMQSYRMADYEKDLSVLLENEKKLYRNDIKEVTMTTDANSATIGLLRNGDTDAGAPVKGAITVTSGGGTGGSGAANDTFVKISNGTAEQTFATGSKVEAIGNKDATTGIKINGEAYTIKSGSVVSVKQNAAEKTTTITVDGKDTTITDTDTHNALDSAKLDGKKLTITGKDGDTASVDLSSIDTDTKYTAGNGIAISEENAISVKLKEGENNLEVTAGGLALKKDLTVDSVKAGATTVNTNGLTIGTDTTGIVLSNSNVSMGGQQIHNVAAGTAENDAVNFGQLNAVSEVANKGWKVSTNGGTATDVKPGDTVDFAGEDNIVVSNTDKKVVVKLGKDLTGLNSVTTNNAYVTNVDASKGDSVTNVEYVKNQITDAALSAGNGISITDKKINVKLKDGEQNLVVNDKGLAMNTALTGIQSITGAGGTINFAGSAITINETTFNKDGRIQNVAAGTETKDAVNFGQLKKVIDDSVNVDFTNISNNGKTEIVNIAKAADVHVKDGKYSVQADGTVTMKYVDGNGNEVTGKELKITDVASAAKLDGLNTTVTDIGGRVTTNSTNITNLKGEVITSGSIGANGKVELTKSNGSKVEVGTVKDYSVTSGTYDQTTKKLTLTKTDAYGNATSGTVDIDLSGIQSGDKNWTAQANGTDVKPNTDNKVNFINGDNTNVTTSGDGVIAVNLNKDLTGIESVSNGSAKLTLSSNPIFGATAKLTNGKASVELRDSTTIINGKVQVRQDGSIGGVTAGRV